MKIDGVHFHKNDRRWNANLRMNGTTEYLGSFKNRYCAMHAVYQKKKELGLEIDTTNKEHERYLEWFNTRPEEVKLVEEKIENLKKFQKEKKEKKKRGRRKKRK